MRLRFTIRDLLWLTLVVAILMAWWIDHRKSSRLRGDLDAAIRHLSSTERVCSELITDLNALKATIANRDASDAMLRYRATHDLPKQ